MPSTSTKPSGVNTVNQSLLALRPRQILLMKQSQPNASAQKAVSLDSHQKPLLLRSVARFLKTNGFSKTLKKYLSEAQIRIDATDDALVDLEELYIKYLEKSDNGKKKVKGQKEQDEQVVRGKVEMLEQQAEEVGNKGKDKTKKKKKKKTSEPETVASATEEESEDAHLKGKNSTDCETHKKITKERKKTTKASVADTVEYLAANSTLLGTNDDKLSGDESTKCKTKKKKKDDSKDTNLTSNGMDDSRMSDSEDAGKDNKGNKKRKRIVSDENDMKAADTGATEESKRRKIDGMKNTKENDQSNSIDQLNKLENGSIDKIADNSSAQKTKKKQLNGSAEPKTVTAFQRVKVDEVVFSDDRLKDNSYWAKDGAETGYGAKAQEVLGQVRGRDFRHEKTKKKRGSYRGGQIDLLSHSVKFNYSDEE